MYLSCNKVAGKARVLDICKTFQTPHVASAVGSLLYQKSHSGDCGYHHSHPLRQLEILAEGVPESGEELRKGALYSGCEINWTVILLSPRPRKKKAQRQALCITHRSSLPGRAPDHTGLLCRHSLHPWSWHQLLHSANTASHSK